MPRWRIHNKIDPQHVGTSDHLFSYNDRNSITLIRMTFKNLNNTQITLVNPCHQTKQKYTNVFSLSCTIYTPTQPLFAAVKITSKYMQSVACDIRNSVYSQSDSNLKNKLQKSAPIVNMHRGHSTAAVRTTND